MTRDGKLKGLFLRGDELQIVCSGTAYRSPDFGSTWYAFNGFPVSGHDVGFDARDSEYSFIGANGQIFTVSGVSGETYSLIGGAVITGETTDIDVDPESDIAMIGTTSKLYKTINWGRTAYAILDQPVAGVALGGRTLANYSLPPVSGYILLPNADDGISAGTWNWHKCTTGIGCDTTLDGTWHNYVRGEDALKYLFWGSLWSGPSWANFYFDNLPTLPSGTEILEVVIQNTAGGGGYAGRYSGIKTHGVQYYPPHYNTNDQNCSSRNPFTGVAWTQAEVNDIIGGIGGDYDTVTCSKIQITACAGGTNCGVVGASPIARGGSFAPGGRTIILNYHPADRDGIVSFIEFYTGGVSNLQNLQVAVFYLVSLDGSAPRGYYTARSRTANLGNFSPNSYHSVPVNLEIRTGDLIGFYASSGDLRANTPLMALECPPLKTGNYTDATNQLFIPLGRGGSGENAYVPSFRGVIF